MDEAGAGTLDNDGGGVTFRVVAIVVGGGGAGAGVDGGGGTGGTLNLKGSSDGCLGGSGITSTCESSLLVTVLFVRRRRLADAERSLAIEKLKRLRSISFQNILR